MSKQSTDENKATTPRILAATAAYSARMQEAMRYDKLRSADYSIVMSIMRAVSFGLTEAAWEAEQRSTVRALQERPADKQFVHADTANQYEQTVARLKDLALWPW